MDNKLVKDDKDKRLSLKCLGESYMKGLHVWRIAAAALCPCSLSGVRSRRSRNKCLKVLGDSEFSALSRSQM